MLHSYLLLAALSTAASATTIVVTDDSGVVSDAVVTVAPDDTFQKRAVQAKLSAPGRYTVLGLEEFNEIHVRVSVENPSKDTIKQLATRPRFGEWPPTELKVKIRRQLRSQLLPPPDPLPPGWTYQLAWIDEWYDQAKNRNVRRGQWAKVPPGHQLVINGRPDAGIQPTTVTVFTTQSLECCVCMPGN